MKEIKINKLDEVIYYDEADNGLKVYMWVNPKVNNFYATLNVLYGSVDTKFRIKDKEYNVPQGIAHFLEHITFNEKDGKTAYDYYNNLGTSINAFTSFKNTSYELFGTESIIDNITHLLDYVQEPVITKELIDKERGIIDEEIDMGKNNPAKMLFFQTNKILFHKNKEMYEISGSHEDIKKITKEDLLLVYNSFYHPSNMFMVITGNFNPYEVMASIKENQNHKKYKEYIKPKKIYDKEDPKVVKEHAIIKDNVLIPKVVVSYKLNRKDFKNIKEDIKLLIVLKMIMNANFGPTSDFKEDLLEKELVTILMPDVRYSNDYIIINITAETKYPNEIIKMIKNNMDNLNITKDILQRRIKSNIAYLITGFDDIEYINEMIYNNVINYKQVINNIYNIYKEVNIDDVTYIIKHINKDNVCDIIQEGN